MTQSVGLFGGTFNPIHNAHVTLAKTICEQMGLDEVWFLVTPQNPFKRNDDLLDENMRLEMARIALQGVPRLVASDYEFHLERPSYTWKTLQHLKQDYPDTDFSLIIGADNWAAFDRWSHPEEILRDFHIIVYPREGYRLPNDNVSDNPIFIDFPLINITSTMLRQMIHEGNDISRYVSPRVLEYIKRNNLYL